MSTANSAIIKKPRIFAERSTERYPKIATIAIPIAERMNHGTDAPTAE